MEGERGRRGAIEVGLVHLSSRELDGGREGDWDGGIDTTRALT